MRKLVVDDSSNVRSITFDVDEAGAGHLDVEFSSGGMYRYAGCTVDDFATACHAPSVGKWVQTTLVRQTQTHPATKLERQSPEAAEASHLTWLQAIASMRPNKSLEPMARAIVDVARGVIGGRLPPPLPPGFPQPHAVGDQVRWIESAASGMHLGDLSSMTPDQAEAVANALLVASMQARS